MNSSYSHFRKLYFTSLLQGQSLILANLEGSLFPELEKDDLKYFPTLARMPTGTGKTGVIAIAAFFANPGSTLILTPWRNLCEQMQDDLDSKFWDHVSLTPDDRKKFLFPTVRMYPSDLGGELRKVAEGRIVLVGTLNGLQTLERNHPATYKKLSTKISLVVVDEGHYEPAVLWGRAVRNLKRPTLIVTATPYRNDLKLFLVPTERVFHYTHEEAEKEPHFPLRLVKPMPLKARSTQFKALVNEFMDQWQGPLKATLPDRNPRAIICCDSKKRVMEALRIVAARGDVTVRGFHERVEDEDFSGSKLKPFFQRAVPPAKDYHEEIWVHQHKLTEGVDDPRFTAILLTYPMTNDRKVIQQVGRILRHSIKLPKHLRPPQIAKVFHSADYKFAEVWNNYLKYEKQIHLTTGEHYRRVVLDYLSLQPPFEYFGRKFRERLTPFAALRKSEVTNGSSTDGSDAESPEALRRQWNYEAWNTILTPPSVLILRLRKQFDMKEFVKETGVAITLRDGVILNVGGNDEPIIYRKNGPVLWLYALITNSDILISRSAYEISIEARFVNRVGEYLFIGDTGGVNFEDYLGKFAYSCDYFSLAKCLHEDQIVRQASLFSIQSLNTAVRRTIRQGIDLGVAPYQVSEKKYVCQNLRAKRKEGVGERYFGLTTSRISDRVTQDERRVFNLGQFAKWTNNLAKALQYEGGSHAFFQRYAKIAGPPKTAKPYALILDPMADPAIPEEDQDDMTIRWQITRKSDDEEGKTKEFVDMEQTVFSIESNTTHSEKEKDWPYVVKLELQVSDLDEPLITEVLVRYEKPRFRFKKGKRTQFQAEYNNDVFTVAHLLNTRHERYAITLEKPNLVYHNRQFFELDYSNAEAKFDTYVTGLASLKNVDFEKIPSKITSEDKAKLKEWPPNSVFAKTLELINQEFPDFQWLFCDDLNREIADFVAANFSEGKAAFIHCKWGGGSKLSASVFHELCSQAAKNLVYLRTTRIPPNIETWTQDAVWEGTQIKRWTNRNRIKNLPKKVEMWDKLNREILRHPKGQVEIWIVMGDGLDVEKLKKLAGTQDETPEVGPLLHLLDGLVANCAEAAVSLRVFGHCKTELTG